MLNTFTATDITRCLNHLGYANNNWGVNFITDRFSIIENLGGAYETQVLTILDNLDAVETQLNTSLPDAGLQVKSDGSVFYASRNIMDIDKHYNYWRKKLYIILDIPLPLSYNQASISKG